MSPSPVRAKQSRYKLNDLKIEYIAIITVPNPVAGTSNHTVSLQSIFRDDFPAESASTSDHIFERCAILRDALPAGLHVQGRGQCGSKFAADVPEDCRESTGALTKPLHSYLY